MTYQFDGQQYGNDGEQPPGFTAPMAQPQSQPQPQFQPAPYGQPAMQQPVYGMVAPVVPVAYQQKSWIAATLLAFFFGVFGVHNFYLGYSGRAVVQLFLGVTGIMTLGFIVGIIPYSIVWMWSFIEFIMILLSVGSCAYDARGVPLQK